MGPVLLANKYLLLKRIASGGMAEIFLAKQVGFDGFEKLVVVKRILPEFANAPDYVRMFLDEAKTAADLRHPNIVSTFEIAEDHGVYFMVMEYLHGLDLRFIFRKLVSHKDFIPLPIAVGIVMEACGGVNYAHKKTDLKGRSLGIVHRDISPQNLVVTFEGETKVVDFGIAQAAHLQDDTKSGILKGKYAYMSPEQANGQPLDHRTDQFSLGIILYELTTMHRLFRRSNHEEALVAIIEGEIERPSQRCADYPAPLEAIVMKALSKKREDRFLDCGELRLALDEYLHKQGSVFSRDRLAAYLLDKFYDYMDPKLDAALANIDPEHLQATYLHPQTQSQSGEFTERAKARPNWSLMALAGVITMLTGLCIGVAVFFITEPKQAHQSLATATGTLEGMSEEIIAQSEGEPDRLNAPKPLKQVKKMTGRLKVVVEPWGEVFIDGERLGLTPLSAQKILEGSHTVRIVNTRLNKEKTLKVVIRANQDTLVRHQF